MTQEEPLRQRYLLRFALGIVVLLLLAGPVTYLAFDAIKHLQNRPPDWVPDSLLEKVQFNEFLRRFSAAELVMVSWEGADLESESLAQATAALRPLCREASTADPTMVVELPNWVSKEIESLRLLTGVEQPLLWVHNGSEMLQQMTSSPANLPRPIAIKRLQGSVVGPDESQTCLVLSLSDAAIQQRRRLLPQVREIVARLNELQPQAVAMVGGPMDGAIVDDESVSSVQKFSPPSAILAALLCLVCLRSMPLTAVIVAIAVLGEGLVLALVSLSGTPMNAVLIVLPPLVFVLTVSSGIHLSNYYLDVAHEFPELSPATAARRAMRAGVMPCLLATGTTVIGLGSLMLVRLEPIRVFGGVASIGVVATLFLLFLLLPGAMVLTSPRIDEKANRNRRRRFRKTQWFPRTRRRFHTAFEFLVAKSRKRLSKPWPIILGFGVVAVFLSSGLFQLKTSVNVPRMFRPDSDIRQQYRWFENHIGPTVTGEVLVYFPPLTEDDDPLKRLEIVKRAHIAALEHPQVDGVLSPLTFLPAVPQGRSLSSTATRSVLRKLIRDPDSSLGKLGFISRDDVAEVWRISVRMPQSELTDHSNEIAEVRQAVTDATSDSEVPTNVVITGSITIVLKAQQVLLRDLFRSFISAFAVVAVVMMLVLRSVLGGLIAMLPNLFPTVTLFGWMGWIDLPLDIGSVMTASVALGIAVDDTVHLLSRFGSRRGRGLGQIRAAWGALGQCGWAMLQTTTVCGLSLLVYWFSDFVPTSRFAILMFGLLAAALLGDLFLLPGLMCSVLGRWLAKPIGVDPGAQITHSDQPHLPKDIRRLRQRAKPHA